MVLYMLHKADFALTSSQVTEFILDRGYTNYFTIQKAIYELEDDGLIQTKQTYNSSYHTITTTGIETLGNFTGMISSEIRNDIDAYLAKHRYQLKSQNEVTADYHRVRSGDYLVTCELKDRKELLARIELTAMDEAQARTICENWRKQHEAVYEQLVHTLILKQ